MAGEARIALNPSHIKAILSGAAIPGKIIAACIIIGFLMSFLSEPFNIQDGYNAAKTGMTFGLFIVFFGIILIVSEFCIHGSDTRNWREAALMAIGFLIVWVSCLAIMVHSMI